MQRNATLSPSWPIAPWQVRCLLAGMIGLLLTAGLLAEEPAREVIPPPKEDAFTTDNIKVGCKKVRVERFEPKADGKMHPVIVLLPGVDGMVKPFGPIYRAQAEQRRHYWPPLVSQLARRVCPPPQTWWQPPEAAPRPKMAAGLSRRLISQCWE